MLIRNARLAPQTLDMPARDVRIRSERIAEIGELAPLPGEQVIDARGGALLPGLHDHHIHLAASAAARHSVPCGPPEVANAQDLARALRRATGSGWLRGTGYHESVAGMLVREQLDAWVPDRPLRIQHRSGRMWFLNTRALETLLERAPPPPGLERIAGDWSGRLFDEDAWLRDVLAATPPCLADLGQQLTRLGVSGVTDMSPSNAKTAADWLTQERANGFAPQIVIAGTPELADLPLSPGLSVGPVKLHLHENALPDLDATIARTRAAHAQGRGVAIHCTTEVELVFALATLRSARSIPGDRIEHAGIAPDPLVAQVAELDLQVVSQPAFIAERGDRYRADVAREDIPCLYRLRAFREAGVTLAAGSDAPYGTPDPWAAMRAACTRRTRAGAVIGPGEALSPEAALDLFLADPHDLRQQRRIVPGARADVCLLDRPWQAARTDLSAAHVRATLVRGKLVYLRTTPGPLHNRPVAPRSVDDRLDKPPVERSARIDTAA